MCWPTALQQRARRASKRERPRSCASVVIHALCGGIELTRWTYRRLGERNGPTCVPVELEAGIIERTTPALAYGIMQAYAKWHRRDHERSLLAAHRSPPSRTTLERVAKALGQRAKPLVRKIEPVLRATETVTEAAHAVVLGLDRTTIPMEEDPTPGDCPKVRRLRSKPYVRQPPSPVLVNYRMAYVGTVTIVDRAGEPLMTRRYAVGAHLGPLPLLRRMGRDLRHALEANRDLRVGVVQDGATELRNLMLDLLRGERLVRKFHLIIDFFHVEERLGLSPWGHAPIIECWRPWCRRDSDERDEMGAMTAAPSLPAARRAVTAKRQSSSRDMRHESTSPPPRRTGHAMSEHEWRNDEYALSMMDGRADRISLPPALGWHPSRSGPSEGHAP